MLDKQVSAEMVAIMDLTNSSKRKISAKPKVDSGSARQSAHGL